MLTVAGQQVLSAVLDHRGWLGMPRRPLTAPRAWGVVLLIAGAVLIRLV